nr:auxin-induced protein 15A-like [Ipomoea batatas]
MKVSPGQGIVRDDQTQTLSLFESTYLETKGGSNMKWGLCIASSGSPRHRQQDGLLGHLHKSTMAFRVPRLICANRILNKRTADIPKGHLAVYVGASQKKLRDM